MSQEKRKKVKATSPKGSLMWFKLVKPDAKFKKYTVDLIVDDTPAIRQIIEKMEELSDETLKEEIAKATEKKDFARKKKLAISQSKSIEPQLDANGNETGKFVMKFRGKSEGINKDKQVYQINPPQIFNAKALPYSQEEKARLSVFNGSIGQVSFEMSPYALATGAVGVTLKPTACMVLKIQQADADASQFGFAASEIDGSSEGESEFEKEAAEESVEDAGQDF